MKNRITLMGYAVCLMLSLIAAMFTEYTFLKLSLMTVVFLVSGGIWNLIRSEEIRKSYWISWICTKAALVFLFYLVLKLYRTYGDSAYVLFAAGGLCTIMAGIELLGYGMFQKKWHVEYLFLCIAIPFGITMNTMVPLLIVPDEPVHSQSAYRISNKILNEENEQNLLTMRVNDGEIYDKGFELTESFEVVNQYFETAYDQPSLETAAFHANCVEGNDIAYILPGVVITICRLLQVNSFWTFEAGRMTNFLLYVLITFFAIKMMPHKKTMLSLIATFPMVIQQAFSYSYDSLVFAMSFYAAAKCIAIYDGDCVSVKKHPIESLFLLFCAAALAIVKNHAFIFIDVALFAMILHQKKLLVPTVKKAVVILPVLFLILYVAYGFATMIMHRTGIESIVAIPYKELTWDSSKTAWTLQRIINDPFILKTVFVNTLQNMGAFYLSSMIASPLGWLNIDLQTPCMILFLVILILSIWSGEKDFSMEVFYRYAFILVSVITAFAILFGMLLSWTPSDSLIILGVQGRYFTPGLTFFLIGISPKKIRFPHLNQCLLCAQYAGIVYCAMTVLFRLVF